MIDTFHILDSNLYNQTFYYNGVTNWQVWQKPPNCSFVNIFLLGGGAGGQGGEFGAGGAGGVTRSGGRGGGSSSVTYATFPAFAIPDTLYIQVGKGGLGGAPALSSGVNGEAGALSYVSVLPDSNYTPQNILIPSGNAPALSSAVNGGTAIVLAQVILSQVTLLSSYAGQDGGAGGASSTPATNVTPTSIPLTGGAGGSGCSSVGTLGAAASINGFLSFPTIPAGIGNKTLGGSDGGSGYSTRENFNNLNYKLPLFFTGGAGGGAGDTSTGGRGGAGAFGCGGGGGGAGFTNTLGGYGGNGGNGLVIITVS